MFRHSDNTTFSNVAGCDGTDATVISDRTCYVEHTSLLALGLTYNDAIFVKVNSINSEGNSEEGEINEFDTDTTARVKTVPVAVTGLVATSVTETSITVSWDDLTVGEDAGGSDIVEYILEWDDASGTVDTVLTLDTKTSTSKTISTGIDTGSTYSF